MLNSFFFLNLYIYSTVRFKYYRENGLLCPKNKKKQTWYWPYWLFFFVTVWDLEGALLNFKWLKCLMIASSMWLLKNESCKSTHPSIHSSSKDTTTRAHTLKMKKAEVLHTLYSFMSLFQCH